MPLVTSPKEQPAAPGAGVPAQSRADWTRSYQVSDFPVPHGREEDWRFTPVERLGALFAAGAAPAGPGPGALPAGLPAGVSASVITLEEAIALGAPAPSDRPAAVAAARAGGIVRVDIPAGLDLAGQGEPVRIEFTGLPGEVAFRHLVITAGEGARGTVLLRHSGAGELSAMVSVITGAGAELAVVSLQEWDDQAVHLAQHDVVVGADASVKHIAVTLGGELVRISTNASYAGPGGRFEGFGVYFADAGQHLEHRLFVDHASPHCASDVLYKGALQGQDAHSVWIGDVLIRAAAEGTDTYEQNRNLVLTDGARADSVPNLEIETGEIAGAGHASTTGRFDDEQLFYLMSRGLPEDEARRLIVHAFFAEVIRRIGIPEVVGRLMDAIDAELDHAATVAGALR